MLGTLLLIIVVLALLVALPRWSHSSSWGYAPSVPPYFHLRPPNGPAPPSAAFFLFVCCEGAQA